MSPSSRWSDYAFVSVIIRNEHTSRKSCVCLPENHTTLSACILIRLNPINTVALWHRLCTTFATQRSDTEVTGPFFGKSGNNEGTCPAGSGAEGDLFAAGDLIERSPRRSSLQLSPQSAIRYAQPGNTYEPRCKPQVAVETFGVTTFASVVPSE